MVKAAQDHHENSGPRTRLWLCFAGAGIALALAGCSAPSSTVSIDQVKLPNSVLDEPLVADAVSNAVLADLSSLAPGITNANGASVSQGEAASEVSVYTMGGPQNSLNSIQVQLAESLGAGDKSGGRKQSLLGQPAKAQDEQLDYAHESFEVGAVRADQMLSVRGNKTIVQTWTVARPSPDTLIAVRDLGADPQRPRQVIESIVNQLGAN